jgi:potassium efflux system protein
LRGAAFDVPRARAAQPEHRDSPSVGSTVLDGPWQIEQARLVGHRVLAAARPERAIHIEVGDRHLVPCRGDGIGAPSMPRSAGNGPTSMFAREYEPMNLSATSPRHASSIVSRRARSRLLALLALATPVPALAQPSPAVSGAPAISAAGEPATRVTQAAGTAVSIEEVQARVKAVEAAQDLSEADRTKLLELYRFALSRLEAAVSFERSREELAALIEQGPVRAERLRAELAQVSGRNGGARFLKESHSTAELEQRLVKEQTELAARRSRLSELEKRASGLQTRPAEAKAQLVEARAKLAEIETETKATPPAAESRSVTEARQTALAARRVARLAEIAAIEQELLSFDIRSQAVVAERELAVSQLAASERQVKLLETALGERRRLDAEAVQLQAELRRREATGKHPAVRRMAEANIDLGEELAVLVKNRRWVTDRRARLDQRLKELGASERTARKGVEIAGLNPALGQILRNQRRVLSGLKGLLDGQDRREQLTADAGLRLFEITEAAEGLGDREAYLHQVVAEQVGKEVQGEAREAIDSELRQFLADQSDLLQKLRAGYSGLLSDLVELDFEQRQLGTQAQRFEDFLDQHLIWTPSAPALGRVSSKTRLRALATFFGPRNWLGVVPALGRQALHELPASLGMILVLATLVAVRRRARGWVDDCNSKVNRLRVETYANTPVAIALCAVMAAPVPLALLYCGWLLGSSPAVDDFARAVGSGVGFGSILLFLGHFLRILCKAGGVGERHLRWPRPSLERMRRKLYVLLVPVPLLAFGVVMSSDYPEPEMSQTVGRGFLIALEFTFSWFFFRAFHPADGVLAEYLARNPSSWQARLRYVWWLGLVAMPLVLLGTAAVGYAYTASILGQLLLLTLWMAVGVVVLQAVVIRWLAIAQRRMLYRQIRERREAERVTTGAAEMAGDGVAVIAEEPEVDLVAIHKKARHLLNSIVGVSVVVGLVFIWAPVVPAFGIFDSVELWTASGVVDGKTVLEPVTLGDLLLALLVVVVVTVVARDLPGFLEFSLLQRLPLAAGSRYAIGSLSQYGFVTLGILFVFGKVGLRWSEVQWLVAALSVGLGFGLQEIVANFISGIILLFERPIRIGDTVTVGELSGTVTRIRIRATTITDWDNKEIIVPNKTFITSQLVNWTLSDSVTRLVIRVGIAYGSDTSMALQVLSGVAKASPLVLPAPEPQVFFLGFGDSSLNFEVRVWVKDLASRLPATHQLHVEFDRALAAAGITIPFPQRDLHLRTVDAATQPLQAPDAAAVVAEPRSEAAAQPPAATPTAPQDAPAAVPHPAPAAGPQLAPEKGPPPRGRRRSRGRR